MLEADVLVVGAGPVGMLAALGLAQTGASVIVVEAGEKLNDSPRAAVYFATSLIALEELGILDDLDCIGTRTQVFGHHVARVPRWVVDGLVDVDVRAERQRAVLGRDQWRDGVAPAAARREPRGRA